MINMLLRIIIKYYQIVVILSLSQLYSCCIIMVLLLPCYNPFLHIYYIS